MLVNQTILQTLKLVIDNLCKKADDLKLMKLLLFFYTKVVVVRKH